MENIKVRDFCGERENCAGELKLSGNASGLECERSSMCVCLTGEKYIPVFYSC